jgi:hypothetical protein
MLDDLGVACGSLLGVCEPARSLACGSPRCSRLLQEHACQTRATSVDECLWSKLRSPPAGGGRRTAGERDSPSGSPFCSIPANSRRKAEPRLDGGDRYAGSDWRRSSHPSFRPFGGPHWHHRRARFPRKAGAASATARCPVDRAISLWLEMRKQDVIAPACAACDDQPPHVVGDLVHE